jgi:hypothetical protein
VGARALASSTISVSSVSHVGLGQGPGVLAVRRVQPDGMPRGSGPVGIAGVTAQPGGDVAGAGLLELADDQVAQAGHHSWCVAGTHV